MSVNEQLVDQLVAGEVVRQRDFLRESAGIEGDPHKEKSACFVLLCVEAVLGLSDEETRECLVEGGNDFGVDAIHISDVADIEFTVTIFQGKYAKKQDGSKGFPMSGIEKVVQAINTLFDPRVDGTFNERLTERVEEIRSLIIDGNIPRIRVVLCSNGKSWACTAQQLIDHSASPQVEWDDHFGAKELIALKQNSIPVKATIQSTGPSLVENYDYRRVAICRVRVKELAALFNREGDRLLQRNIRRYLGQVGRVNRDIDETLRTENERGNFYFYNNGVTMVCSKFRHNELQEADRAFQIEGLEIINGGQTCKTIQHTLNSLGPDEPGLENAFVLIRLYELTDDSADFVRSITYATNSQNPVDLRDLRSNDPTQRKLETSLSELKYEYVRYRSESSTGDGKISSALAASTVLAVWRKKPQLTKYQSAEHFGRLYDQIFTEDLNGAQVALAVEIFRMVERKRKAPAEGIPQFVAYASAAFSMLIGQSLLKESGKTLEQITHDSLDELLALLAEKKEDLYSHALGHLKEAVRAVHGVDALETLTLHRMAGCFRRGDLLEELHRIVEVENS